MATDFGLCPVCGAPKIAANQGFCGACGSMMPAPEPVVPIAGESFAPVVPIPPVAPSAAAAEPPAWASHPADYLPAPALPATPAYSQSYPPAPQGYAPGYPPQPQGYAPGYPPPPQGYVYPQAYSAPRRVNPAFVVIGGVIAMAVIALAVVVIVASRNGSSGAITFSPSTISCTATTTVSTTVRLPSSMKSTDELVWELDGVSTATSVVADNFKLQSDGAWIFTSTSSGTESCSSAGGQASMGSHTIRIMDATGHVVAQGSYTLKP